VVIRHGINHAEWIQESMEMREWKEEKEKEREKFCKTLCSAFVA